MTKRTSRRRTSRNTGHKSALKSVRRVARKKRGPSLLIPIDGRFSANLLAATRKAVMGALNAPSWRKASGDPPVSASQVARDVYIPSNRHRVEIVGLAKKEWSPHAEVTRLWNDIENRLARLVGRAASLDHSEGTAAVEIYVDCDDVLTGITGYRFANW